MRVWNEVSKSGLKHACMPNHEIITSPGIIPFWEIIQGAVNSHYRNVYVKDWDASDTMSVVIDDVKYHLNYKVTTDYLWLIHHIRENRLGMVNHTIPLT